MWIRNLHWETKCVRRLPERIGSLQGSYAILEQQYDPVGRAYKASNPTTAAPNIGPPRNSTDWGHPTKTTGSAMRFTASCVQIFLFAIHRAAGRDTPCRRSGQNESGLMRERRNEGSGIAEPGRQHLWHLPPWRPAGPSTLPQSKTQGAKHMMVARENAPKHLLCGNKSRPSLFRFSHQYVPCI